MIKKQTGTIILLIISALILALIYFIGLKPLLSENKEEKAMYDKDGDLLDITGSPYVYEPLERQEVEYIKVQNKKGTFTLRKDSVSDEFVFDGAEKLLYDQSLISSLYVACCKMGSVQKIDNPSGDLSIYGLDMSQNPVRVETKSKDGAVNVVYIGDMLVTGGAYYAKHSEKPYIYALSTTLEKTVLADVKDYFIPLLAKEIDSANYGYTSSFSLKKNGELFIECEYIPDEEREKSGEINIYRMIYPAAYIPSNERYLDVLSCFISFKGEKVCEYGVSEKENYKEILTSYGFDTPSFEITYSYGGNDSVVFLGNKLEERDAYYAYSPYMDIIATLPLQNVPFIEWSIIDYVSKSVFQRDINRVDNITLSFENQTHKYHLEGEGQQLSVSHNGKIVDTKNFRQLYILLLSITMQGYAETEEIPSGKAPVFTMQITLDSGKLLEYKFYSLTTGRLFYTVDGKGEFYVSRESINKIIEGTKALAKGEKVDAGLV